MTDNAEVSPVRMPAGQAWEFTHGDIEFRVESRSGRSTVELYWRSAGSSGSFAYRSSRRTDGRDARRVAHEWAREITHAS